MKVLHPPCTCLYLLSADERALQLLAPLVSSIIPGSPWRRPYQSLPVVNPLLSTSPRMPVQYRTHCCV